MDVMQIRLDFIVFLDGVFPEATCDTLLSRCLRRDAPTSFGKSPGHAMIGK